MRLPDERLARIVFVTERYGELRGLVSASTGAFLILGVITWTMLPGDVRNVFQNIAFFAGMGTLWAMGGVEAYYERWYGRAPLRASSDPRDPRPVVPDTVGAQAMMLAILLDMFKGFIYPGGGSIAAAGLVAYSTWVIARDWRYRAHYAVAFAAGTAGLLVTWAVPLGFRVNSYGDAAVAVPYVVSYALIGLALVFVGVLDHRLLARAMRPVNQTRPASTVPDEVASRLRAILSSTSLLVVLAYLAIGGWPAESQWLYWGLYMTLMAVGLTIQIRGNRDIQARIRRAEAERTRLREERLARKVASLRGEVTETPGIEPLSASLSPPQFDAGGHMILPIAMAAGALADVLLRGAGMPSLLATALALSHLRIAVRDWPSRQYYLLGTTAAAVSAIHFMFVTPQQILDWTVWFLILICAAMLIEGLLDLRIARIARLDNLSKEHHADAI